MQPPGDHPPRDLEPFAAYALGRLREQVEDLTRRWLAELRARLPERPQRIFPDETLLNRVPELLRRMIDAALRNTEPTESELVLEEVRRLSDLRRSQGYELQEIVAEFEILRDLLLEELQSTARAYPDPVAPVDALDVAVGLQTAVGQVVDATSRIFTDRAAASRAGRAELLSAFGRSVSHELRNRLNAALLSLRVYRETEAPPVAGPPDLLANVERSLRQIEHVLADVFAVAVAQQHHAQVEGTVQALDDLLEQTVGDLRELAQARKVCLQVRGAVPSIPVDGTRVQLILMNILTNAIKYCDVHKPERSVEVRVTRGARAREWQIDVADNGIGIPTRLQPRVFEESLAEVDGEPEDRSGGLGLALARRASQQIGGRLWFDSVEGEGSTFSFTVVEPSADVDDVPT